MSPKHWIMLVSSLLIILASCHSAAEQVPPTCQNPGELLEPNLDVARVYSLVDRDTGLRYNVSAGVLRANLVLCPPKINRYDAELIEQLRLEIDDNRAPSLSEFINKTRLAFEEFVSRSDRYVENRLAYTQMYTALDAGFLTLGVFLAIVFTLARKLFNRFVIMPLSKKLELTQVNSQKLTTSAWFALSYTGLWLVSLYVVVFSGREEFFHPLRIFDHIRYELGYFHKPVPGDIHWLYAIQCGFYVSAFFSLFTAEDRWREDKVILGIHHVVTIGLLLFSYYTKFYLIGAVVLFLHDLNDIFLEFGKCNVYMKFRHGRYNPIHDKLGELAYVAFVVSWIVTRLYWFPAKILYTTGWGVYITHLGQEVFFFIEFNVMLWILFAMHIYWSYLIAMLAVKILSGQMKNLTDIRESDVDYTENPTEAKTLKEIQQLKQSNNKAQM